MLARQQVLSKPIKIEFTPSPDLLEVEHDSDQMHQVLLNLLLNSVQAIEGSGLVRVAVFPQKEGDDAVITVSDTGSRNFSRASAEYLPAVLYDQGKRHRTGSFTGAPDYRGTPRAYRSREQFGKRHDFLGDAAVAAMCAGRFVSVS